MTTEQIVGLSLTLLVMLAGLIGSILPALPGTPLMLIAAIGHRLYFGTASISNLVLGVLIGLMVVSLVFDFLASMLGAKKFGATWRGMTGAVIGGIIGLFFSLPGIILGPFVGAMLFEMLVTRNLKRQRRLVWEQPSACCWASSASFRRRRDDHPLRHQCHLALLIFARPELIKRHSLTGRMPGEKLPLLYGRNNRSQ
ncbi:MAG: DUF456 domain-containing protein [Limisphaerales bacterium]